MYATVCCDRRLDSRHITEIVNNLILEIVEIRVFVSFQQLFNATRSRRTAEKRSTDPQRPPSVRQLDRTSRRLEGTDMHRVDGERHKCWKQKIDGKRKFAKLFIRNFVVELTNFIVFRLVGVHVDIRVIALFDLLLILNYDSCLLGLHRILSTSRGTSCVE